MSNRPRAHADEMSPEELFLSKLEVIERVVASVCRRHCLYGAEAEDFGSGVKLKLIADDYAVLRKFRGKSLLETYLTTVIVNLYRDYQIQKWGKWRPSAKAKRLGQEAIQLEQLLYRDGRSLEEAVEILIRNFRVGLSRQELTELAAQLPQKSRRRIEGEDQLPDLPGDERTERRILDEERAATRSRAEEALEKALERLSGEDRLLLKMRFWDGFTVARIASSLKLEQRPLYTRFENLSKELRATLEGEGVGASEVAEILGGGG